MRTSLYAAFGLMLICLPLCAYAETDAQGKNVLVASDAVYKKENAAVVELFTSQGCSYCPPAEAYMRELSRDPNVLTLEYHIDYWNGPGRSDPFSKSEWTERQVSYNRMLMDTARVYTPQMVIDGRYQGIGSQRKLIRELMDVARVQRGQPVRIVPHVIDGKKLLVSVTGGAIDRPASVALVRFLKQARTSVTASENGGRELSGYNIVTSLQEIGRWPGGRSSYKVSMAPLEDGESCAILVQDPETMRILAGRFCGL